MPLPDALLSADSLVAGLAVAPLLHRWSYRLAAAVLLGCADGAASFAGASIAISAPGPLVAAPAVVALYGAYLIAVSALAGRGLQALHDRGPATRAGAGKLAALGVLGALAVALSVDNLVASAGASVVAMGCASAALTLVGLSVGGRVLRGMTDRRRTGWVGAGVIATALMAVLS
jgi:putative Mn2+ efflux pump MntP